MLFERARIAKPPAAEDYPEGRLLGEPKATKAILQFLTTTRVVVRLWLRDQGLLFLSGESSSSSSLIIYHHHQYTLYCLFFFLPSLE
jgi:hypothetical protein